MSLIDLIRTGDEKNDDRMGGVVIGIVTDNKDPMGRVKLSFPWRKMNDQSKWARISTLMAGNGRGSFFLPEIGDEVLVAFEHGDINYPYVIGALWNGIDTPPDTNHDGNNDIRKIRSRSGHEIVFNDKKQGEQVVIHTNSGHTILLDDSTGSEKIEIKDKNESNKIVIDSVQNNITINSEMSLTIQSRKIEMEADILTLNATTLLKIKGTQVMIN